MTRLFYAFTAFIVILCALAMSDTQEQSREAS
jgi:hypothetical protein